MIYPLRLKGSFQALKLQQLGFIIQSFDFSIGDYTPTVNEDDNDNSHSSHEIEVSDITKEGCERAQPSHFDLLRVLGQVHLKVLSFSRVKRITLWTENQQYKSLKLHFILFS
jgi:hypothetical protein